MVVAAYIPIFPPITCPPAPELGNVPTNALLGIKLTATVLLLLPPYPVSPIKHADNANAFDPVVEPTAVASDV